MAIQCDGTKKCILPVANWNRTSSHVPCN